MVVRNWFIIFLLFSLISLALSDEKEEKKEPAPKDWSKEIFVLGENLTYSITWKGIYAGKATISIDSELATFKKRPCYVFRSSTRSSDMLSTFYEVNSTATTLIDKETLSPLKFTKNIREGNHRAYQLIYFYPEEKKIAFYKKKGDRYVLRKEFTDVGDKVQDVLSALAYLRTLLLKNVGDKSSIKVCTGKRITEVEFEVKEKKFVKVEAGEFLSLKITTSFKPDKEFASKLESDEGLFVSDEFGEVWFDVLTRRPVLMTASVPIGTVRVELSRFKFPIREEEHSEQNSPPEKPEGDKKKTEEKDDEKKKSSVKNEKGDTDAQKNQPK
ncbi:MAG: DUF3108 domain-containing protein [Planctomycetota bacterium]|nr:DUF3108 domain-containing protein [Planctomycetota bacterium]